MLHVFVLEDYHTAAYDLLFILRASGITSYIRRNQKTKKCGNRRRLTTIYYVGEMKLHVYWQKSQVKLIDSAF
jgi:hypothetical protein